MAGLVDKSLSFGLQNFFFVAQDTTGLVYDYVAYQDKKGSVLLARYKKDDTEGLYYIAIGVYAVIWAARAGYTYQLPSSLKDPSL